MKAAVINRQTGQFNAFFQYNLLGDFGALRTKSPKFLMVTGLADLTLQRGQYRLANSVLYVAEATTGQVAVYGMPWNQALQAAIQPQQNTFVLLDKRQFRTAVIRD